MVYRIDIDAVGSLPTPAALGTEGFFRKNDGAGTRGTVVTADWLNMVQEELVNLLTVTSIARDKTDSTQVEAALRAWPEVAALLSASADTTATSTTHTNVLLAAAASQSAGTSALVGAAAGGIADGTRCAALAVFEGQVGGTNAALLACSANAEANLSNQGDQCAVVATSGNAGEAAVVASGAEACALIACADATHDVGATNIACALIACTGGEVSSTAQASALIGCGIDSGGDVTDHIDIEGDNTVAIASDGDATVTSDHTVVLASAFGTPGVTVSEAGRVVLFSGSTKQIHLDRTNGEVLCQLLDVNNGVADGTGSTMTLGSVGGTDRPATAAMDSWLKISVNGVDKWIPLWA